MNLNHYIAQSGVCSRRDAVELIKEGLITVNHAKVIEPFYQVKETDTVRYRKKVLTIEKPTYLLLNKPKSTVTTARDPQKRKTVFDCIKGGPKTRLFAIGRLDFDTTGLIVLTNDGSMNQKLAHPAFKIKKIYIVTLDRPLDPASAKKIKLGLRLRDGIAKVDSIFYPNPKSKRTVKVTLHSGKNRIIRRIFQHCGYFVRTLDRINYAGLTKESLKPGQWRFLNAKEIASLKK